MSFGWRKYSLNTGEDVEANVVDGLVFDVKVNLGIDIDFDADFDVIEVMGDFEDDIVSLFVFFVNRQSESPSSLKTPAKSTICKQILWISEYFWIKNNTTHAEGNFENLKTCMEET